MFNITDPNQWGNTWWMDPVILGRYPKDGLEIMQQWLPKIGAKDMKIINQPLDFLGVNIYNGTRVKMGESSCPEIIEPKLGHSQTLNRWSVTPESLYWGPKFFYERYGKPILITENGMSNIDWVSLDGKVHDPQRIDFLHRYLNELKKLVKRVYPLKAILFGL